MGEAVCDAMSRRIGLGLVGCLGVSLALVAPAAAVGGRPFTTTLTGAAEVNAAGVPNQGDLDGVGTASLHINPGRGEVCWTITVSGVDPITAAHIHHRPADSTWTDRGTTGPLCRRLHRGRPRPRLGDHQEPR